MPQRFSRFFSLCYQIIISGLQFLSGVETIFLNVSDSLGHLLQVRDFNLLSIGSALLCLHIILQINNQSQICFEEQYSRELWYSLSKERICADRFIGSIKISSAISAALPFSSLRFQVTRKERQ